MTLSLSHFLCVSVLLFIVGLVGLMMNRHRLIRSLLALEVLLLSVHVLFVSFSAFRGDIHGQVISLFVIAVGAAEAAIGLALLVLFFRRTQGTTVDQIATMRD
jgi:NADH-quinone oxidoreductase subunit K